MMTLDLAFRTIFDNHTAIQLLLDHATGAIVDANQAACAFYGYSREEFSRLHIHQLNMLPPDQLGVAFQAAAAEKRSRFVFPHRLKSGEIRQVEVHSSPVKIQERTLLLSIIQDITERIEAEQQLQKRTEELQRLHAASQKLSQTLDLAAIYETLHSVVIAMMPCDSFIVSRYNPQDNFIRAEWVWHDGETVDANLLPPLPLIETPDKGTQSIAIRTRQSLLLNDYQRYLDSSSDYFDKEHGLVDRESVEVEDVIQSVLIVPLVLENQSVGVIQVMSYCLNAYTPDHLAFLESLAVHVAVATRNAQLYRKAQAEITERQRTEAALRDSERHFRLLFDQALDATLVLHYDSGRILQANAAAAQLLGRSPAELHGHYFWTHCGEAETHLLTRIRRNETATDTVEIIGREGRLCPVDLTVTHIDWRQERALLVTLHDISERMQLVDERLQSERLRMQIEKDHEIIALRDRFISILSHEFRTPLSVILSSTDILVRYHERLSETQRIHRLQEIEQQVHLLVDMIDDVLRISRLNAGKQHFQPVSTNLRLFCRMLLEQVQHIAGASHRLHLNYSGSRESALIDEKLLAAALTNLLSNAIKYSPQGGDINFDVLAETDRLVFRVSDQGMGIPAADQEQLFEAFFRASNTQGIKGTGLGLSIVQNHVCLHGGTVEFVSVEGEGTIFTVEIPQPPDSEDDFGSLRYSSAS